jgi:hypothetical protein
MGKGHMKAAQAALAVPETAKHEAEAQARWAWVEASVWTDPMLAALQSGVKGGRIMPSSPNLACSPCTRLGLRRANPDEDQLSTGEPYAGKPHVRFGGRGGETLPYPYHHLPQVKIFSLARF